MKGHFVLMLSKTKGPLILSINSYLNDITNFQRFPWLSLCFRAMCTLSPWKTKLAQLKIYDDSFYVFI